MNFLKEIFSICFIALCLCVYGQSPYDIAEVNLISSSQLIKETKASFELLEERIDAQKKYKRKKELKREIEEFEQYTLDAIKDGEFFRDDILYPYVREVLDALIECNRIHDYGSNLMLSRNTSANAYCMIDGSVVVTIGLLTHLENRDQLMAILSHELSHDLMSHGYSRTLKRIGDTSSKEYKNKVKKIAERKYQKGKVSTNELKKERYQQAQRSRASEFEADSLGFQLFTECNGRSLQFLRALMLRSEYDTLSYEPLDKSTYVTAIGNQHIDFDTTWLDMEDYSGYVYHDQTEILNQDSIETHPDDSLRTGRLSTIYAIDEAVHSAKQDSIYLTMARTARRHFLPALISSEQLDVALYYILYSIQYGNAREHYVDYLRLVFKQLWMARKEYKYNRYVDSINPRIHAHDQQQLLSFLWNLSKADLKNIAENL